MASRIILIIMTGSLINKMVPFLYMDVANKPQTSHRISDTRALGHRAVFVSEENPKFSKSSYLPSRRTNRQCPPHSETLLLDTFLFTSNTKLSASFTAPCKTEEIMALYLYLLSL